MIDSPIRLNTFYKNSKKSIPFSSVESFDSRSNAVAVSGDTIPSKVSPIRTNVNTHAHVFRRKQNELTRNVRGSVILIPAKGANPSPPTIAPAITTNTIKAIRPGPITRHYYKPNTPFTTPTPLLSTQVVIDSEQEIDAEPLVVLNGQKRPAIVSSGFRATIMTSTTSSITTRSISFPTTISRATPSGKELAIVSDAPCFLKYSHRALPNYEEKALNGVSLRDCLVTCLYTSDLYCASVNYDFSRKICIVNGGSSSQTKTALQTSKTIDYYENVCPPAQPRTPDQLIIPSFIISRCLTPIVNTILEDLDASLVTSAQTLEECQSECLRGRGRRGKVCGGMNWIRATNGCMIFPPQYDRQQLSFAKDVTFFMNSCTEESFDEAKKEKTKNDYYEDFAQ
ncbi:unnamed protein product, partial [Mesorhabditis belari]|uniref:Apple domain-containing protein n=1 Tax=Mesorhabditis belari TaxID=2138241 RepID=A0AAF3ESX6_9BILA